MKHMKSKGGKREWLCPECRSVNIYKSGKSAWFMTSNVGVCVDCNSWWSWTKRINIKASEQVS